MSRRYGRVIPATMILAGMAVLAASPAEAQRRTDAGGRGYFSIGMQQLDVDELNERFEEAGYPAASSRALSLGGGGLFTRGRLLIGGEGQGVLGPSESVQGGTFATRMAGGYGMLNVGYTVFRDGGLSIFPLIGLGGGGMSINITERSAPTFDEILDDPRRSVTLNSGQLLLGGALGIDYVFPATGRRGGGPMIGLRAGYAHSPLRSEWSAGRGDIADGPDAGYGGAYIRLLIGGGRR